MTPMTISGSGSMSAAAAVARATNDAETSAQAQEQQTLEKVAQRFEAIFTRQLVKTMRSSSLGESIDGSSAVDNFREIADANMADDLASRGGLGIAEMILQQLGKSQ